jgi:hypothetical protein
MGGGTARPWLVSSSDLPQPHRLGCALEQRVKTPQQLCIMFRYEAQMATQPQLSHMTVDNAGAWCAAVWPNVLLHCGQTCFFTCATLHLRTCRAARWCLTRCCVSWVYRITARLVSEYAPLCALSSCHAPRWCSACSCVTRCRAHGKISF